MGGREAESVGGRLSPREGLSIFNTPPPEDTSLSPLPSLNKFTRRLYFFSYKECAAMWNSQLSCCSSVKSLLVDRLGPVVLRRRCLSLSRPRFFLFALFTHKSSSHIPQSAPDHFPHKKVTGMFILQDTGFIVFCS